jgi:colanic acid/amylovoran biosynthesis glycosyltransferase
MTPVSTPHVAYVVKRYPRFSETFIVNEILAHEAAGARISIFSLRPPVDSHFQSEISRVRAPVEYLPGARSVRSKVFWRTLQSVVARFPETDRILDECRAEDVTTVYQALELALAIQREGIDHLHAHFATSATSVARLAARFAGVGYTFTAHAKDIFHESVGEEDLRAKLASAAAVVTVSDFNVSDLRRRFGDAADRVRRIYNGLDLQEFPFHPGGRRTRQILAVGRLVEKKGFSVLIDACALLRDRGEDFQCRIIGGGEQEERLRRRVAERGLQEQVELPGLLPRTDVIREMRNAAVVAAPCVEGLDGNRDGLPTVLLEAMALGAPCVSTAVTGIPELVEDGIAGLLIPQRDAGALANALLRILKHPELGRSLAVRARRRIEADFDIQRNAAHLRRLFHSETQVATHAA